MPRHVVATHLTLAALTLVACSDGREPLAAAPDAGLGGGPGGGDNGFARSDAAAALPPDACQKMDIVFVVDDSRSMTEEQDNLASTFGLLTARLDAFTTKSGAKLDYRVAVTTTGRSSHYTIKVESPFPNTPTPPPLPQNEKGDDGRFRKGCGMQRPWVERADPNAAGLFACVAKVGAGGPSLEMPLEALRLSMTDRLASGDNVGFFRDDALAAFVIVSDEDDCSRRDDNFTIKDDSCAPGTPGYPPVSDYVAAIDAARGGRNRWAAAVFAGETSCNSAFGSAVEAKRLKEFVGLVGKNGLFASICAGDLTTPLEQALAKFDGACRTFAVK